MGPIRRLIEREKELAQRLAEQMAGPSLEASPQPQRALPRPRQSQKKPKADKDHADGKKKVRSKRASTDKNSTTENEE